MLAGISAIRMGGLFSAGIPLCQVGFSRAHGSPAPALSHVYTHFNRTSKHRKQKQIELRRETDTQAFTEDTHALLSTVGGGPTEKQQRSETECHCQLTGMVSVCRALSILS